MASSKKLQGITIEIDGNTTKLSDSLKDVNKVIGSTQSELKNINSLLKLDPGNTTLLAQQQKVLADAIKGTSEKLETLREAKRQADARIASGAEEENSASYRELEREIVATESQLRKLNGQLDENSNDFNKLSENIDNAGDSTLKFGDLVKANLLSEAIKTGIQGLVSSFKALGSAMVNVGKQAVESFAEYEQLVGGVETLFEDSASTVENYANNAYKTAGLSANEYMSTVTSFSASLLQSLGGDTEEAAKYADMAITDMADNANKMGTSMESIQNAYQGFAKQNYTMLDNLKLGYGGTKTEMERLLKDATAISGVKYNINELNDVYEAIHVIQGELGITGTTAKEASKTISGSITAMSSSWQNLLTGIASGNENIGELVTNVVDSVLTVADNIMPVIEQVVNSFIQILPTILNQIIEYLPQFLVMGTNILMTLVNGFQTNMPQIISVVLQIVNAIVTTLITNLPQILKMGIEILVQLIKGIAQAIPDLIPQIVDVVIAIVNTLVDNLPMIIMAGIDLILALAFGLIEAIPQLVMKIPEIITKLVTALTKPEMLAKIISGALQLIIALAGGLITAIPTLIAAVPTLIFELLNSLKDTITKTDWAELGKNVLNGILNGLINFGTVVKDTVKKVGKKITNEIKSFFGIKSPSRLMEKEVGKFLPQGIAQGFEKEIPATIDAVENSLSKLNTGIQASINPTINPQANTNPLIIQIENFNNERQTDIQALAEELEFYRKNSSLAIGGK